LLTIDIYVLDNEITVVVSRNSKFYDEASFHLSEKSELKKYINELLEKAIG